MRQVWGKERMIVVFQPHRYTRTQALMNEFAGAFGDADCVILTDIYAASETVIPGVSSRVLYERIRDRGHAGISYIADFRDIVQHLDSVARPGDVVLTLGAGSVWKIGEELLQLRRSRGD